MAQIAPLPGGSWQQTARGIQWDGRVLSCELQKIDGSWVHASIDFGNLTFQNLDGCFVPDASFAPLWSHVQNAGGGGGGGGATAAQTIGVIAQVAGTAANLAQQYGGSDQGGGDYGDGG